MPNKRVFKVTAIVDALIADPKLCQAIASDLHTMLGNDVYSFKLYKDKQLDVDLLLVVVAYVLCIHALGPQFTVPISKEDWKQYILGSEVGNKINDMGQMEEYIENLVYMVKKVDSYPEYQYSNLYLSMVNVLSNIGQKTLDVLEVISSTKDVSIGLLEYVSANELSGYKN